MQPPSNQRATWPSHDDNGGFYVIVALVCSAIGAYLVWDTFHGTISRGVIWAFHQEIRFIQLFTDAYDLADRQMMRANPDRVTLKSLYNISRDVGTFYRIPAALLMMALGLVCMVRAAPSRFRRKFDLDGLIREQARSFPSTAAFVARRLRLTQPAPADPRPSDYALSPAEWIGRYATAGDGSFEADRARAALVRQLGPVWRGVGQASPVAQCLFAVSALHLAERRAEAIQLLGDVSQALAQTGRQDRAGTTDPAGPPVALPFPAALVPEIRRVLADYAVVAPAAALTARHAYTHPALMTVLTAARRQAGVLAPGQFAWLKLVDRPLWYALHSLGFESEGSDRYNHPNPRAEAAGARDHWAVECVAGEPVIEPSIDRALGALERVANPPARRLA